VKDPAIIPRLVIALLENTIENYAWGSRTAIPSLLGMEPDGKPQAELWIGAHPKAPSRLNGMRLDEVIASDPARVLGDRVALKFGALPFLMKVLAAAEPLSIQCHPNRAQAKEGFARENAAGIPLGAAHRNYRDDNHKPELIVALTEFRALKGFRTREEIAARLGPFDDLGALFVDVMSWPKAKVDEVATRSGDAIVAELSKRYPGDPGTLAPLFLNAVTLSPGQALFLRDRELHSYLEGTGIEIMANSDNVLRGGLTPKHVDVPELERILSFAPGDTCVLDPIAMNGERTYETPAAEFVLSSIRVDGEWRPRVRDGVEILLCVEGAIDGLPRGRAGLVQCDNDYTLSGKGTVFRARVPA
jgi:mannose-6-phosphate isomerase